jgi:hypothetical protein
MEKKKTRVIEGWVAKTGDFMWRSEPGEMCITIYKKKELKENWLERDWPPRKVRITVEEP